MTPSVAIEIRCAFLVREFFVREHEYNGGTHTESGNGVRKTIAEDAVGPEVVIRTSDAGG